MNNDMKKLTNILLLNVITEMLQDGQQSETQQTLPQQTQQSQQSQPQQTQQSQQSQQSQQTQQSQPQQVQPQQTQQSQQSDEPFINNAFELLTQKINDLTSAVQFNNRSVAGYNMNPPTTTNEVLNTMLNGGVDNGSK